MELLFGAVLLFVGLMTFAIFTLVFYSFFKHAQFFSHILDQVTDQLKKNAAGETTTSEMQRAVCGHCGTKVPASESQCPSCGAGV